MPAADYRGAGARPDGVMTATTVPMPGHEPGARALRAPRSHQADVGGRARAVHEGATPLAGSARGPIAAAAGRPAGAHALAHSLRQPRPGGAPSRRPPGLRRPGVSALAVFYLCLPERHGVRCGGLTNATCMVTVTRRAGLVGRWLWR